VSPGARGGVLASEPVFELFDLELHDSLLALGFAGRLSYSLRSHAT
jgi:hypothetical protein